MNIGSEMERIDSLKQKCLELCVALFNLDESMVTKIDSSANLFDQLGVDSLQAFEAIITLHEILDQDVPRDVDTKEISTLDGIAAYLEKRYPGAELDPLLNADVNEVVAERRQSADAF